MRLKGKEGQRVTGKAVSLAAERRWPDEAAAGSDPSCVDAPATRSRSFLPRRRARASSTLKLFAFSSGRLPVHRVWGKKSPDRILHAQCISGALKKQQECAQVWWLLIQLPPPTFAVDQSIDSVWPFNSNYYKPR